MVNQLIGGLYIITMYHARAINYSNPDKYIVKVHHNPSQLTTIVPLGVAPDKDYLFTHEELSRLAVITSEDFTTEPINQ